MARELKGRNESATSLGSPSADRPVDPATLCSACKLCAKCSYPNSRVGGQDHTCIHDGCSQPGKLPRLDSSVHTLLAACVIDVARDIGVFLPNVLADLILEHTAALKDFRSGGLCYATDYVRLTYCAEIQMVSYNDTQIFLYVHYLANWADIWDEWISYTDGRVFAHETHSNECRAAHYNRNKRGPIAKEAPSAAAYCAHQKFCQLSGVPPPPFPSDCDVGSAPASDYPPECCIS